MTAQSLNRPTSSLRPIEQYRSVQEMAAGEACCCAEESRELGYGEILVVLVGGLVGFGAMLAFGYFVAQIVVGVKV